MNMELDVIEEKIHEDVLVTESDIVQEEEEEESDEEDDAFGPKKKEDEEDGDPVAREYIFS